MHKLSVISLALAVTLASAVPVAQKDGKYAKAERLADAVGLSAVFDETKEAYLANSKSQVEQLSEPLRKIGATPAIISEVQSIYEEYDRTVTGSWDTQDAARAYVQALSESLTEAEIVRATRYYESPEGRRVSAAVNAASVRLAEYVDAKMRPTQDAAMKKLIDRMLELRKRLNAAPPQGQ